MKILTLIMATLATVYSAQAQQAHTTKKTFSRTTTVSATIQADPAIVWALLTNAHDYARWNTTIVGIEGDIEPKGKIKLKSTLDPKRTFKLKVKKFQPESLLVWGDAMGKRTFTLTKGDNNTVIFTMTETIGGPIFPLFAKKIPSFDASFNQFAQDLKKEAESIQNKH